MTASCIPEVAAARVPLPSLSMHQAVASGKLLICMTALPVLHGMSPANAAAIKEGPIKTRSAVSVP